LRWNISAAIVGEIAIRSFEEHPIQPEVVPLIDSGRSIRIADIRDPRVLVLLRRMFAAENLATAV